MIIRWVYTTLLLSLIIGILLYLQIQMPWFLAWFGTLPGDLILSDKNITFFLPLTTAGVISTVWCLLVKK
ncbi:MAG: DUF2905 domain-containing protein [Chlamydiae bacterium CG10_big_fil_rev_8_21_14_0_10_35_9]|nr:MAG: DUF2905 domain-containing protein [Chlamydiae bacterium CG10_big_fil_rev_8_21_14_0_10_35_9]